MCTAGPLENVNIDEICRACFQTCNQYKMLIESTEIIENKSLGDIFVDVVKIEPKTCQEPSPSRICLPCSQDLLTAYNFIQKSLHNNERLIEYISNFNVKQLDCLSECPIDIPKESHAGDFLQIKIENECLNEYVESSPVDSPALQASEEDDDSLHTENKTNKMQCPHCSRIFKRIDFLENHKRKHEEEAKKRVTTEKEESTSFLCDECGVNCISKLDLEAHHLSVHSESKNALKERQLPKVNVNTRSRTKRIKTVASRFECDKCSKTFAWKKDLYRHERYHQPNIKKFPCPHCDRRFIRKDKLTSHLLVHLTGVTKSQSLKSTQPFAHQLYSEEKPKEIKCMICNYDAASNVRELVQHINSHKTLMPAEGFENSEIVKRFYPGRDVLEVFPLIANQIEDAKYGRLHSIVNSHGYEMGLSDSDQSDADANPSYTCEACNETFNRKHKLITHQSHEHTLDECTYKCKKCKLKFLSRRIFESHLKHHCKNPDKDLHCTTCPGRFTWPRNLENHQCKKENTHNTDKENTTCDICGRTFAWSKDLRIHKKNHIPDGKSHDCSICGEKFLRLDNLRCHLKTHSKNSPKNILCMLCQEKFPSIRSLRNHLQTHSDGTTGVNYTLSGFVSNYYTDIDEIAVSEYIQNCFKENKLWQLYLAVNRFGLEMSLSDSDSDDDQNPDCLETYICELCDMKFPRMQAILQHQYVEHNSENSTFPHKCDKCDEQFICKALLQRHQNSECSNTYRIHACTKCNTKFTWKQNLVAHNCLRPDNEPDDSKKCEVCGKKFVWLKDLHRHKRSHIPDEKKFECLVCGKKFNRKDNMRAHMKVHAVDYKIRARSMLKWEQQDENICRPHGAKIIQCKICLSKHNSIRDLANHLTQHKDQKTLSLQESEVGEVSMMLYNKEMNLRALTKAITRDLTSGKHDRFYSITNEVGYELSVLDSETCTDMDADDDEDGDTVKRYICKLCNKAFDRKFKIFEHQRTEHLWKELPFECTHCAARFVCESIYQVHLQRECKNNEKLFKCRRCPLKFTWKENLKAHERYMHDRNPIQPKKHHCSACDKSFLWHKDLLRHKKIHQLEEEKFKCTWCFRIFMRRDNLKVHMKVHQNATHLLLPDIYYLARPNGIKVAECKHCGQKYSTISQLHEHIRVVHFKYQTEATTPSPASYSITNTLGYEMDIEDSETEKEEPIEKYFCELCNARFNRRFKLLQHQQAQHYSDNIPHRCDHCNFKCVSEPVLDYHMRTQCKNPVKQFRCSKCTMRFMWQENLENHESLIHDSPRTHSCDTCKRDFATQHDLENHSDCKPPAEQKFFHCSLCERKYNRKDRLMKHMKAHNTEVKDARVKNPPSTDKKFLCAFCGKEVSSSSNLVIHMRRHTGEKPFKCEFCTKGFPRSSDLSCHRRTHTGERPHKCTVCDKAFSRSYKLQTHMRIHSGERPYKCTYCDKSFTQSNDLTLHVRRHTGERPYICETCGERFIQGTALRNHRRMRGHYEI